MKVVPLRWWGMRERGWEPLYCVHEGSLYNVFKAAVPLLNKHHLTLLQWIVCTQLHLVQTHLVWPLTPLIMRTGWGETQGATPQCILCPPWHFYMEYPFCYRLLKHRLCKQLQSSRRPMPLQAEALESRHCSASYPRHWRTIARWLPHLSPRNHGLTFNSMVWEWMKSELICKWRSVTCVYWGCYLKPFHTHTAWLWLLSPVASRPLVGAWTRRSLACSLPGTSGIQFSGLVSSSWDECVSSTAKKKRKPEHWNSPVWEHSIAWLSHGLEILMSS